MVDNTNPKDPAAISLGRKGGKAGRGDDKRRSPEHYRMMVERRALNRLKKRFLDNQ